MIISLYHEQIMSNTISNARQENLQVISAVRTTGKAAAIWRWSRAVVASRARRPELGLRQAWSALYCAMVDNVSGVNFAHQRPRNTDFVYALSSMCLRPVTKIISICFEQRSSGRSSCMRARDWAGRGREGVGRACWHRMQDWVQAGARSNRPADLLTTEGQSCGPYHRL